jgi:hypothetical protein
MSTQIPGYVYTGLAGVDLSSSQYLFIRYAADGQIDPVGTLGGWADGVLDDNPDTVGYAANVAHSGIVKVKAAAAIIRGAKIMSDATGKATPAEGPGHFYSLGVAMDAAAGANEVIRVLMHSPITLAEASVTVDMANAGHALVMGTAGAAQTKVTGSTCLVDPNGGAQNLDLPAEASFGTGHLFIVNTANAAEAITVRDDSGASTIVTLAQNESGWVYCDGTAWRGFVGGIT